MNTFNDFKLKTPLKNAIADLGFAEPTPIQQESYSSILAGNDLVGIAQTGTGKTVAYLLPILQDLKYSEQEQPRVLILVPTRELVIQIVEQIQKLTSYMTVRVVGVYGGSNNITGQRNELNAGVDIVVGTPRRLYDLALTNLKLLKSIKKLVIDEVDIMLDFGYRTQLKNIFDHLPEKRQNILFSATMTGYVEELIDDFLVNPVKRTIAVSGTPLDTISQECYAVPNFYTKSNLLNHLLDDKKEHNKVLIFVDTKNNADRLYESFKFTAEAAVIHAGKEQNHRTNAIEAFVSGHKRILIATDVIARGIDIEQISTVVSFDTPAYSENYIHRIGRTGRAGHKGRSILLTTEKEDTWRIAIEQMMNYEIPFVEMPDEVNFNPALTPEEKGKPIDYVELSDKNSAKNDTGGAAFHEKSAKNSKEKQKKKTYSQKMKEKFGKPLHRGDKIQNERKNKRK